MVLYIFLHAKIFCNNIVTYICKLCLYNVYLAFLCQMNWFSNLMTFYLLFCFALFFFLMRKHQVHCVCMFKHLTVYLQRFVTFLCGCYCFSCCRNDKLYDAEVNERWPLSMHVTPCSVFIQAGCSTKNDFFMFLHAAQNITNCSIWFFYGSIE